MIIDELAASQQQPAIEAMLICRSLHVGLGRRGLMPTRRMCGTSASPDPGRSRSSSGTPRVC
jgi:hypothetical protein